MSETKTGNKNGKIELLRFIFAAIIMLFHFFAMDVEESKWFASGALGVEFFFVLSGWLMMASIDRAAPAGPELGSETLRFLGRKVKAVYPEVLVAFCIGFVVHLAAEEHTFVDAVKLLAGSIWEAGLLRQVGLQVQGVNTVTWYISSMLICMAVLYPLTRKYPDMMTRVIIPLTSLLALGYLCQAYASPRDPHKWIGWTYKGTVRAYGEIGAGMVTYMLTKRLKALELTRGGKVCITALEPILYAMIVFFLVLVPASRKAWIIVPVLMAALCVTFSEQTYRPHLMDNKVSYFLGRYSLPLYLGHHYWANYLPELVPKDMSVPVMFAWYLGLVLASSATIWGVSAWIRHRHIGARLARLFVKA